MKLWVTLEGGRDAEVEFTTDDRGRLFLVVDGRRLEADFHQLPDGEIYSLIVDGRSHEVRVSPTGAALEVAVEGDALEVEVRHPLEKLLQAQRGAAASARGETITAPMPGLVVAIRVKPGDSVIAGQGVAVVEAMKMQNELLARHGGVVRTVHVAERATVSAGQPLISIAPEGA
jgi:pyruvate carboxylase subunit B